MLSPLLLNFLKKYFKTKFMHPNEKKKSSSVLKLPLYQPRFQYTAKKFCIANNMKIADDNVEKMCKDSLFRFSEWITDKKCICFCEYSLGIKRTSLKKEIIEFCHIMISIVFH